MAKYVVYGNLNCPFSYALYELLANQNLLQNVEWRVVERSSESGSYLHSVESMSELASDIFNIRNRSPGVTISLPLSLSDSLFPSLCVIAAQRNDPVQSNLFLSNLYRALWIKGKDIANPSTIFHALEEAGINTELETDEACEETLLRWQNEWEHGNFGLRTPAIVANDGRRMVGLLNPQTVLEFMQGADVEPGTLTSSSRYQERMTIALLGEDPITELWPILSTLRDENNILLPQSLAALQEMLLSDERCPDLVLLHNTEQHANLIDICRSTSHLTREKQVPLAVIGTPISDTDEVSLYDMGVADYLLQQRNTSIIQARINILLQLKRAHDMLARAASIDTLTQVYNRREFERCFETEWRRGQRSRQSISVILIDIDHFKAYNDNLGHLNGDNCLRQIASSIRDSARRAQDLVCRFGGEEFIILLPETDRTGAEILAEHIRQQIIDLDIRHSPNFKDQPVTISLGVASTLPSQKGQSPKELIDQADIALYKAKKQGRNQVAVFDE
ncbi:diguanylate cyclase [Amphritea japonica]|uniref:diguanylate cyclase n=1 Tax=Amphritea japonica ATCC BAA-1530 TaxID=1278309 RepID=A0A7R6PR10_9GAMM|nr:diguanylate cyclase [Amphritea japonica]BBB27913.1 signal transduction protein [Amphritea japonica ATCC BAA-1530]